MSPWQELEAERERICKAEMAGLFVADPQRAKRFSVTACDLLFDFSKTHIDDVILTHLLRLVEECGVAGQRDLMLKGYRINSSEDRAVLHTALREQDGQQRFVDHVDIMPEIHQTLATLRSFANDIRNGIIRGSGGCIENVVNIGIGGSHLGPEMACRALSFCVDGPPAHFIANIDGAEAKEVLAGLNPKTTLVIVASKTFTTLETMTNAESVRQWLLAGGGSLTSQFAAVSSDVEKCRDFGIAPERVFGFGDYIGGRYSVWGPVGLALMIAIGPRRFQEFLNGGNQMDGHFATAPAAQNLPVLHALTGIWHNQVCRHRARAILPYDRRLRRLPAYLQQLIMESNGKSVTRDGTAVSYGSAAIIWGEPGTNGQHAFYQALHQGTQVIPCEFLLAARGHEDDLSHHHEILIANCLAQSEALMTGRQSGGDEESHRGCPGSRPSTTLVYPQLSPSVLGQIIAMNEHSVFVEGAILGINSFDQWGVELGKEIALSLLGSVGTDTGSPPSSGSTAMLLDYVRQERSALAPS